MELGRLGNGERISGVSAILLFAFMCLHWFGSRDSGELRFFSVDRNAWEALDFIPIVLLTTVVATLAAVVLRPPDTVRKLPIPINAVVAILGIISVSLILFRILNPPNFGSFREIWGTISIEGTIQFPIYLALFAAAGIACGGCLAMREEARSRSL